MNFETWWGEMKPAECDEVKEYFLEAWEVSAQAERELLEKDAAVWRSECEKLTIKLAAAREHIHRLVEELA